MFELCLLTPVCHTPYIIALYGLQWWIQQG